VLVDVVLNTGLGLTQAWRSGDPSLELVPTVGRHWYVPHSNEGEGVLFICKGVSLWIIIVLIRV